MEDTQSENRTFLTTELRRKVAGYLSAMICSAAAAFVVITGQIINDNVPPFQVSFIRFVFMFILGGFLTLLFRVSPKIPLELKPIGVTLLGVAVTFCAGLLFVLSSWYLPVTVVHGTMESVVMILAGGLACIRGSCKIELPIGIAICSVGCLLLSQPQFIFHNRTHNTTMSDQGIQNCTEINICKNLYNISQNCSGTVYCPQIANHHSSVYGFIFVLGLGFCLWQNNQFNLPYLLEYTPVCAIVFWFGLGCAVFSLPVIGILEYPIQPVTEPFMIFVLMLSGISFSINYYFIFYAATLIPFSQVAVILPTALVYLYAFQKTYLKYIQPGPGNWLETVGLVMVIVGSLIPPVLDIAREKWKQNVEDNQKTEDGPLVGREIITKYDSVSE